jgi:hypothetical protein
MPGEGYYREALPFWTDTDAYTDRDRAMFTAGFEFAQLVWVLENKPGQIDTVIHRENESRVRMACGRFGRSCIIEPCMTEFDPAGTWSYLTIHGRRGR